MDVTIDPPIQREFVWDGVPDNELYRTLMRPLNPRHTARPTDLNKAASAETELNRRFPHGYRVVPTPAGNISIEHVTPA